MFLKIKIILLTLIFIVFLETSFVLASDYSGLFCYKTSNCALVEILTEDYYPYYKSLALEASHLPSLTLIEETDSYWHGLVRSRFFRFPDDLQIICLPLEKTIQIKSESRFGMFDFGVNKNRINSLLKKSKLNL